MDTLDSENRILNRMEALLTSRMDSFEQKISESQRQISDTQLNKIQQNFVANDNFQFKKKGNEEQFKVNVQVLSSMRDAESHLSGVCNDRAEAARQRLQQGTCIDTLLYRQKLIKMADSSELGWRVVQEYESHPLADDSEDEKKIYRAHIHADRKVRQEKKARAKRYSPYQAFPAGQHAPSSTRGGLTLRGGNQECASSVDNPAIGRSIADLEGRRRLRSLAGIR